MKSPYCNSQKFNLPTFPKGGGGGGIGGGGGGGAIMVGGEGVNVERVKHEFSVIEVGDGVEEKALSSAELKF